MVDMKISFISHLCDVETWPMTNGRNVLPFAMKSYTSWLMVDLDLPFSIWCFHNLAYGRCIFHVPVYHLPVEVHAYHLPMMKNMISTMCHLPSVYAPDSSGGGGGMPVTRLLNLLIVNCSLLVNWVLLITAVKICFTSKCFWGKSMVICVNRSLGPMLQS